MGGKKGTGTGKTGGRAGCFLQEAKEARRSRTGFQSRRKATQRGLSELGDGCRTLLTGRYGGRGLGLSCSPSSCSGSTSWAAAQVSGSSLGPGAVQRRCPSCCRVVRGSNRASPREPSLMSSQANRFPFDWQAESAVCPGPGAGVLPGVSVLHGCVSGGATLTMA